MSLKSLLRSSVIVPIKWSGNQQVCRDLQARLAMLDPSSISTPPYAMLLLLNQHCMVQAKQTQAEQVASMSPMARVLARLRSKKRMEAAADAAAAEVAAPVMAPRTRSGLFKRLRSFSKIAATSEAGNSEDALVSTSRAAAASKLTGERDGCAHQGSCFVGGSC